MTKTCTKCNIKKELSEFRVDIGYRHPSCNDCRLEYSRKYNKQLKEKKKYKLW